MIITISFELVGSHHVHMQCSTPAIITQFAVAELHITVVTYVAVMCVCSVHQQLVVPAMATSCPRYLHHVRLTYNCILDPATAAQAIVCQAAVAARDCKTIPIAATSADALNTVIAQGRKPNTAALTFLRYIFFIL